MIDKGICDTGFIWNPSNCECECDKSYHVRKYLDDENCGCRKKLVDKLVKECFEDVDGNERIYNETLNDYGKVCNSCIIYIVLFVIAFVIIIGINDVLALMTLMTLMTFIIYAIASANTNIKTGTLFY